jgi:hypothetical protein
VLRLSAERTAEAHPFNTTPEHTAQAREIMGPNARLAPEHTVLLSTDAAEARAIGRKVMDHNNHLTLTNYISNWKRMGFTDADLTKPGSDKSWTPRSPTAAPTTSPSGCRSICGPVPTTS